MLAENLRRLRRKMHLTQRALAEASGLHVRCISKIERRERIHVRPETLAALAAALKQPLDALVRPRRKPSSAGSPR